MDSLVFTNRMSREILEIAKSMNIGIATLWSGRKIEVDSNVRVYILYPNRNEIPDRNLNNNSLVLKVVYGNTAIFFVGDVETVVEQKMILHYKSFLLSDILKVGHHGSLSSTSDNFLRTAQPKNAIISVGMHNRFNHPSPFILKRLAALSIRTYSTDKLGAIVLECNGQQCIRRDWR
jgi:competence protein ComEC